MTNKELIDKIREEILHLKMKELQRTNGINTGADVYLSSYAVLSILSNALTEESEDERIRKWLVDYFGSIKKTVWIHRDITCEQILAYLEKQKEQVTDESDKIAAAYQLGRSDERKQQEQKPWKVGANAYFTPEQKPAWSEEDEDMLNSCISSIEEAKENRYAYKETDGDTSYDHEIAWLKSLRPSWKPSEEQMEALYEAAQDAAIDREGGNALYELYEHLKRLRP